LFISAGSRSRASQVNCEREWRWYMPTATSKLRQTEGPVAAGGQVRATACEAIRSSGPTGMSLAAPDTAVTGLAGSCAAWLGLTASGCVQPDSLRWLPRPHLPPARPANQYWGGSAAAGGWQACMLFHAHLWPTASTEVMCVTPGPWCLRQQQHTLLAAAGRVCTGGRPSMHTPMHACRHLHMQPLFNAET
jgi:hypothetical protein